MKALGSKFVILDNTFLEQLHILLSELLSLNIVAGIYGIGHPS